MPITKNTPWEYIETAQSGKSAENHRHREPDVVGERGGSFPKPASLDMDNGGSEEHPDDEVKRKTANRAKAADAGALVDPTTKRTGFENDKGKDDEESKKGADGVSFREKLSGTTRQLRGYVTRDPELQQHGEKIRTGKSVVLG